MLFSPIFGNIIAILMRISFFHRPFCVPTLITSVACAVAMMPSSIFGQGCVAAHGAGMPCGMLETGLHAGEPLPPSSGFQASYGYRWLHSDRHFTGDHEDSFRHDEGSQVINDSHFSDLSLSYSFTPRVSATVTLPFVVHDRSQTIGFTNAARQVISRQRYDTQSSGIGDVRFLANSWVLNPAKPRKGNILLGLGFSAPTGEKDARDTFQVLGPNNTVLAQERTVDQSIQPGIGGWGIILDLYAYRQIIPRLNFYVNGDYTITPANKNGVPTFRRSIYEREMSVADSYMGRLGLEGVLWPEHGLTLSIGPRIEGVPVYDLIGGSDGFRRPGYAISMEPGIAVMIKDWSFSLYTPVAIYRNRERSVPDKQAGGNTHGDAAFADFLVMFNASKRF